MKINKLYLILTVALLTACSKHDPILPGVRYDIFPTNDIVVENKEIPEIVFKNIAEVKPDYYDTRFVQDSDNVIWENSDNGTKRKIFSGFPTDSYVSSKRTPAVRGEFIYAGLSTGEAIKVNIKTREPIWTIDVYQESNMTGGASVLDITAPIIIDNSNVFVGGLGGEFCNLRDKDGFKNWCLPISVGVPFVFAESVLFIVSTNNKLYAINSESGEIYWVISVKKQFEPKFSDGFIKVGKEKFNIKTGKAE